MTTPRWPLTRELRLAKKKSLLAQMRSHRIRMRRLKRNGLQAIRGGFVLFFVLVFLTPQTTLDKPLKWSELTEDGIKPFIENTFGSYSNLYEPKVSPAALETAMKDEEGRVRPLFRIPQGMESSVRFWLRVYTEFTSQQLVLFDERHPELIYEVIDLRDLVKHSRNLAALEILSKKKTTKLIDEYKEAFSKLVQDPQIRTLSPVEERILTVTRSLDHPHPMRDFQKNFRVQRGQRDAIIRGLQRADLFFPKMERIFNTVGIPEEITRLSLVESSFNHHALSPVGALGVWQFMRDSAEEFLVVNEPLQIDERLSPLKASLAAAHLLKRNYSLLKTWSLAITSYNHGFTAIRSLILTRKERQFLTPEYNLAEIFEPCSLRSPARKKLGWASRNYYPGFLAVLYAEKYRDLFYGKNPVPQEMQVLAFHQLPRSQTASDISKNYGLNLLGFKLLNPDIKNPNKLLPKGLWIVVPADNESQDLANLERKLKTISFRETQFRIKKTGLQSSLLRSENLNDVGARKQKL